MIVAKDYISSPMRVLAPTGTINGFDDSDWVRCGSDLWYQIESFFVSKNQPKSVGFHGLDLFYSCQCLLISFHSPNFLEVFGERPSCK